MHPGALRLMVALSLGLAASALAACAPAAVPRAVPSSTPRPVSPTALVVRNGTVIDGSGAVAIGDGAVVIEADRIFAVGPAAGFSVPGGTRIIDAQGGTILPGVIDAHLHGASEGAVRRVWFLLEGVTSVCDVGSPLDQMPAFAKDARSGPAARGYKSGPIVTVRGGYPDNVWHSNTNYEVTSADGARAAVADLVARGADVIKIALEPGSPAERWPMLDLDMVEALVQEAHARGTLVRAHIGRTSGTAVVDIVLKAGVDAIEHVPMPFFSARETFAAIAEGRYDLTAEDKNQLTRLAAQGVVMVPTLTAHTLWCEAAGLTPLQKEGCYDFYQDFVRFFHNAGGLVALANDWGADDAIERGMPLREMELLLGAGLTPMEVIQAATQRSAWVCGHGDEVGTLEPGKLADVIVVAGDPLADIGAMGQIVWAIKGGQVVFPVH